MKESKWGKSEEKCWVQHILWSLKIWICFWIEAYFFSNGHIRNVVSTLPNVVKIGVENDNVVSTLSNVVQFNVEKHGVVSTLFYIVNFNVDIHNIVSTFIRRCATLRYHINPKLTWNRRWNVCWEGTNKNLDDLMKKVFFRCNSPCFRHLLLFFTGKTNIQKF